LNQGSPSEDSDRADINIDSKYIVDNGDIIFSWSGTLLVKMWAGGKGGLNQHLFKVTSTHYPKWYYFLWTIYHLEKFKGIAADKATTMGHIKRADLDTSFVLIPEEIIFQNIDSLLKPMLEKQLKLLIEVQMLSNLRDTLLPKLMSGEIDVSEIEL
jgi:type I restriction enzyme S subunit